MRHKATKSPGVERVQTGVRMEKRMVKVLKAVAELRDITLGELLEFMVRDAIAGKQHFEDSALPAIRNLAGIYGCAIQVQPEPES